MPIEPPRNGDEQTTVLDVESVHSGESTRCTSPANATETPASV